MQCTFKIIFYCITPILLAFACYTSNAQHFNHSSTATKNAVKQIELAMAEENAILKKGENIDKKIRDNLFVQAIVSKSNCYVGEPITITYKLFTRLSSESKVIQQPSFSGCTVQEISTTDSAIALEKHRNKYFKVYTIRKVVAQPLAAGKLTIPSVITHNTISFYSETEINKSIPDVYKAVNLSSPPLVINVVPLPSPPATLTNYVGGIGQFTIKASVDEPVLYANTMAHLRVTLTGSGHVGNLKNLQIQWPASIKSFDPTISESIIEDSLMVGGTKTVTIPFICSGTSNIQIPTIAYTYFNPILKKYITISANALPYKVHPVEKNNTIGVENHETASINYTIFAILAILTCLVTLFFFIKKQRKTSKHTLTEPIYNEPILENKAGNHNFLNIEQHRSKEILQTQIRQLIDNEMAEDDFRAIILAIKESINKLDTDVDAQQKTAIIHLCNQLLYSHQNELKASNLEQLIMNLKNVTAEN